MPVMEAALKAVLSRAHGFRALAVVRGGKFHVVGELDKDVLSRVDELFTFITSTFKQLRGGSVRVIVAEYERLGLVFVRLGFESYLVALYSGLPLGAAYYEARRMAREITGFLGVT
jgi:predicted regulator of Ras-like GTPase activity (Roadblock/LC7/MglB family)